MTSPIAGFATPEATQQFEQQGQSAKAPGHFRQSSTGLTLSSLGMGTYLGEPDATTDALVTAAAMTSIQSGVINILDTAINYRYQLAERALGQAIAQLVESGTCRRDQLFISSKNGYLTPDAASNQDFRDHITETFLKPGLIKLDDIVDGMHCMAPGYLANQLDQSLTNLGLETLDLMYLHNAAESQLPIVGPDVFWKRLEQTFAFYEQARQKGYLRYYGMATWDCFRVSPEQTDHYLSLEAVVQLAQRVGGENHGFRFIQLPYNVAMPEALVYQNQMVGQQAVCLLEASYHLGVDVFTSVPLMQGQLLGQEGLPTFPGLNTPAQWCLQFARSTPGVLAPLVGHKQPTHVADNLGLSQVSPLNPEAFYSMFLTEPVA